MYMDIIDKQLKFIDDNIGYYQEHFKKRDVYVDCDERVAEYFRNNINNLSIKSVITPSDEGLDITYEKKKKPDNFQMAIISPERAMDDELLDKLFEGCFEILILGGLNKDIWDKMMKHKDNLLLGQVLSGYRCHFFVYENIINDFLKWLYDNILILTKTYNPIDYPKYDNYDAIEVSKVCDIPMDYKGVMGVPITFLDKYNPEQFQIVWTTDRGGDGVIEDLKIPNAERYDAPTINGKGVYKRILIRFKIVGSCHKGGGDDLILPNSTTYDPLINGKRRYYRIFIQRDLDDE